MLSAALILPMANTHAVDSSANVALTSNYVFRGKTLSDDNPAAQAGYDIAQSEDKGWYAGAFLSMFDDGSNDGIETDLYAGWKGRFGKQSKFEWDAGLNIYEYQAQQMLKARLKSMVA